MKTKYNIHFEPSEFAAAAPYQVWLCKNKRNTVLARLYYYDQWGQYVSEFNKYAVFSANCLSDIADFLNQLNAQLTADMEGCDYGNTR